MEKLKSIWKVYGVTGLFLFTLYKLIYAKLRSFKSGLEILEWAEKKNIRLVRKGEWIEINALPDFPDRRFKFRPLDSDAMVVRQHFFSSELLPVVDYFNKIGVQPNLMIDAGGNIGAASCFMHWNFPEMRSLVLEPSAANAKMAEENLKEESSFIWEKALWWRDEIVKFDESRSSWAMRVSTSNKGRKVSAISLSGILSQPSFSNPDYIKIDIEGAEEIVFEKDEELGDLVKSVTCISVEPHSEKGMQLIESRLIEWGYRVEHHGELIIGFRNVN